MGGLKSTSFVRLIHKSVKDWLVGDAHADEVHELHPCHIEEREGHRILAEHLSLVLQLNKQDGKGRPSNHHVDPDALLQKVHESKPLVRYAIRHCGWHATKAQHWEITVAYFKCLSVCELRLRLNLDTVAAIIDQLAAAVAALPGNHGQPLDGFLRWAKLTLLASKQTDPLSVHPHALAMPDSSAPCKQARATKAMWLLRVPRHLCWTRVNKPRSFSAMLMQLLGHTGYVRSVAYSPDGKHIVSGSDDRTVRVWNAASGKQELGRAGVCTPVT